MEMSNLVPILVLLLFWRQWRKQPYHIDFNWHGKGATSGGGGGEVGSPCALPLPEDHVTSHMPYSGPVRV